MVKCLSLRNRLVFLLCYCAIVIFSRQPIQEISGEEYKQLLQRRPEQTPALPSIIKHGKFELSVKAHYKIAARVLERERYYFDWESSVSPVDLFLGWGLMSDINIIKNNLNYYYMEERKVLYGIDEGNVLEKKIDMSVANVHIIPLNNEIKNYILQKVKKNDLIYLEGDLVDIVDEGEMIRADTSLVRGDLSPGGCEIMLVRKIYHLRD